MKKILALGMMVMFAATAAFAQADYSIREMTPAVKSALESRKARFGELKALKTKGMVGENNRGYVQVMGGGSAVKALVNAENRDRKFVYESIVEQNGIDADGLATVEKVFARVQRDKAERGEKVQDESGQWN
jgi:uncharacterized protein YdbL (DUF1318 family)